MYLAGNEMRCKAQTATLRIEIWGRTRTVSGEDGTDGFEGGWKTGSSHRARIAGNGSEPINESDDDLAFP